MLFSVLLVNCLLLWCNTSTGYPSEESGCGGDPNAVSGCGYHCNNTCNVIEPAELCPRIQCFDQGCDCKQGYIYDKNIQLCVEPQDCSPPSPPPTPCTVVDIFLGTTSACDGCGGDPNAITGCGYHCNNTCNVIEPAELCPKIQCFDQGCDCKPGYIYDDSIQLCVEPQNCSPPLLS